MPFVPHTLEETGEMLAVVGCATLDDLFADIGANLRPKSFELADGLSEAAACGVLEGLAGKNGVDLVSFLGAGYYDHSIPKAVDALVSRGEFLTAYTPYQPEVAQGTLQAIFEFQSSLCRLLEMEVANASVYDGGMALFEACMMAVRHTKRQKLVVDECVNPIWRNMLLTAAANQDLEFVVVPHKNGSSDKAGLEAALEGSAAVMVQNPNFFGAVDDFTELFAKAHAAGALGVLSVYPVLQAVLKTPGAMGADIAVADGQSVGMPLSFGGPYLGMMTCTKALVRQLPGRMVGRTTDVDGNIGYVLTLQAREQHIRRAKATSNICSNQALCALRSLIHMSLLGPEGLTRVAELSMERCRELVTALTAVPGVEVLNASPFGNEVALKLPIKANGLIETLAQQGYVPGFPVGRYYKGMDNVLLVACTEKNTSEQIRTVANMVAAAIAAN